MNSLQTLFLHELADRHDAEKRFVRALPKLTRAATCKHLQLALQTQLKDTTGRVKRLETVFTAIDVKARSTKCEGTLGLLLEAEALAADFKGTPAINAALISVVQKFKHHGIAAYGCLHEWAALLGHREASGHLKALLDEEKATDHALDALARTRSNPAALDLGNGNGNGAVAPVVPDAARKPARAVAGRMGLRTVSVKPPRSLLV
jgi:ferritin-like metal-binding protein YciE